MILVTGSSGFVGVNLCERLLKEGHEVTGIDNLNDYYDVNFKIDFIPKMVYNFGKHSEIRKLCKIAFWFFPKTIVSFCLVRVVLVKVPWSVIHSFRQMLFGLIY